MAEPRSLRVTSKVTMTILVWTLFAIFVLGPLLTIVTISFVQNIFQGEWKFSIASYQRLFSDPSMYGPIFRSLEIALVVMAIQLVFGSLIAYSTVRDRVFGAKTLDAMSNITIALPSVVVGLALLAFYGGVGPVQAVTKLLFGGPLTITWTMWIVVFAHVLETFPYMVRSVSTGILKLNPQIESAALSLGARRFTVFRTITLPQLRSSLVAGAVLVFSRSIAEFGATIVVVSAVLRTAPIMTYVEAEAGSLELASAMSVVLMSMSFIAYLLMTRGLLAKEKETKAQI